MNNNENAIKFIIGLISLVLALILYIYIKLN